jgi:hypothetical protein
MHWKSQIFEFSNFDSFEVLGCSGAYIPSFAVKIHQPHGLVVESVGLLTVRFPVQSCGGRIAGLDQPCEAS